MADKEHLNIENEQTAARARSVIEEFDSGDCFCIFALLPKKQDENEHDRMWRSFSHSRDSGSLFSIDSNVVEQLLLPMLKQCFDPAIPANSDPMNPCALLHREPSFEWHGENAYAPDAVEDMLACLRGKNSEVGRRIIEHTGNIARQAKGLGTEVVFSGP